MQFRGAAACCLEVQLRAALSCSCVQFRGAAACSFEGQLPAVLRSFENGRDGGNSPFYFLSKR